MMSIRTSAARSSRSPAVRRAVLLVLLSGHHWPVPGGSGHDR